MAYRPQYSRGAEKYLDTQTQNVRKRIMDAVDKLPDGDVRKLQGRKGYRLTVGGFRVLFDYLEDNVIDVVAIGSRGDVYKKQKALLVIIEAVMQMTCFFCKGTMETDVATFLIQVQVKH